FFASSCTRNDGLWSRDVAPWPCRLERCGFRYAVVCRLERLRLRSGAGGTGATAVCRLEPCGLLYCAATGAAVCRLERCGLRSGAAVAIAHHERKGRQCRQHRKSLHGPSPKRCQTLSAAGSSGCDGHHKKPLSSGISWEPQNERGRNI